jgi:hypothetical protein
MGRIVDLCGEVAAEAEEGPEGLILPIESWDRLRGEWRDEEIEDALALVRDSLFQSELVEAADSLGTRLLEVLGSLGSEKAFARLVKGEGLLSLEIVDQLARRVDRLEEVLEIYREGAPPDRMGFDALRRRLVDHGIQDETPEDAE